MRVLFTTQPGEGHLNPLIPLAHALTAAGHEVAVACASAFCSTVEARGFRAFPVGRDWTLTDGITTHWPQARDVPRDQFVAYVLSTFFAGDLVERALPDLLALADTWSPDVIVRETNEYGGWLAAEMLGLPHASVEVSLFAFYQRDAATIAASLTRLLERMDLPARDVPTRLFAYLHLSFVPPSLEDPNAPPPITSLALRPLLLASAPGEPIPPWLADLAARPTVYATLGTLTQDRADRFAAIIAGVGDLDVNLVVTLGRMLDPAQFGPQPDNVHLVGYISQAILLPHCDIVVNHGGFSTILGALASGVPMVILPGGADHPVNARRAAALGTAVVLDNDQSTPAAIGAAVRTVLDDPHYRKRAQQVQTEIQALPGPERGVELLEQLVAAQRPSLYA